MERLEKIRLNKYLSSQGICSRREADRLIEQGRVIVNDKCAEMGQTIMPGDMLRIQLDSGLKTLTASVLEQQEEEKVIMAFYKPIGVVCTKKDKYAKKTIDDCIQYPIPLKYAGRLDKDSEGLLLLTNDGDLIQNMMRSANAHEKEYVVTINKCITDAFLDKMKKGVYLKELEQKTRPCIVEKIGEKEFKIILTQGLNRQIRRMCQTLGAEVVKLKRIRVVTVPLGTLKPGEYRILEEQERRKLYEALGYSFQY